MLVELSSATIAAVVTIGVTYLVERCGGAIGGVIGTVPHVAVVGSVGLSLRLDSNAFQRSVLAMAVAMLLNSVYALSLVLAATRLRLRLQRRLSLVLLAAMSVYLVSLAFVIFAARLEHQPLSMARVISIAAWTTELAIGVAMVRHYPSPPPGKTRASLRQYALRGSATFVCFMLAMLMAKSVPALSGILINFPFVTSAVWVALWTSGPSGEAVAIGAVGPMVLGMLSASAYAILASGLMVAPALRGAPGACLSWALAVGLVTVPTLLCMRRCRRAPAALLADAETSATSAAPAPGLAAPCELALCEGEGAPVALAGVISEEGEARAHRTELNHTRGLHPVAV